jgi:hypothetical protein
MFVKYLFHSVLHTDMHAFRHPSRNLIQCYILKRSKAAVCSTVYKSMRGLTSMRWLIVIVKCILWIFWSTFMYFVRRLIFVQSIPKALETRTLKLIIAVLMLHRLFCKNILLDVSRQIIFIAAFFLASFSHFVKNLTVSKIDTNFKLKLINKISLFF